MKRHQTGSALVGLLACTLLSASCASNAGLRGSVVDRDAEIRQLREERARLSAALSERNIRTHESQANFLLADFSDAGCDAGAVLEGLKSRHVLVRHFDTDRLRGYLRISIGTPEENAQLLTALDELL